MSAGTFKTRYMILRKTPFRDTSLVVAGISADHGRLDFVLKGARAIGKKQFPTAGVFREFLLEFRPSRRADSMPSLVSLDLTAAHDGLAESMVCYLAACSFASETLRRALAGGRRDYAEPDLRLDRDALPHDVGLDFAPSFFRRLKSIFAFEIMKKTMYCYWKTSSTFQPFRQLNLESQETAP